MFGCLVSIVSRFLCACVLFYSFWLALSALVDESRTTFWFSIFLFPVFKGLIGEIAWPFWLSAACFMHTLYGVLFFLCHSHVVFLTAAIFLVHQFDHVHFCFALYFGLPAP